MMNKSCFSRWRSMLVVLCITGAGCNLSDIGPTAYRPPDQFFAVLSFEHHAINLSTVAPYDTVTLHTTREMGDGSDVPGEVVYSVKGSGISITNGVLKAEGPVTKATVYATLTYGTITRTDSAVVSVIATAPNLLGDFGLRLPAGDSAKIGASSTALKTIPLRRQSESGLNLSTLLVSVWSSDSTVASINQSGENVSITPRRPGKVVLYTSTYAFGTAWQDSLEFTVGLPVQFAMSIFERFAAGSLTKILDFSYRDFTIGVGGCVMWVTQSIEMEVDLQFDDTSHVDAPIGHPCGEVILDPTIGGNIAPFRTIPWDGDPANFLVSFLSPYRARVFSAPGIYRYRSTLYGTTGIIRVCDERNDTTCAQTNLLTGTN